MRLPVLISVCLSLATTWVIAKNTEFSQSRNLPPLRLAAADLDTILLRTQSLIAEANGPSSEQDSGRESVKLGVGGREIEIPHLSTAAALRSQRSFSGFLILIAGPISRSRPSPLISATTPARCRSPAKPRIGSKLYPSLLRRIFFIIQQRLVVQRSDA